MGSISILGFQRQFDRHHNRLPVRALTVALLENRTFLCLCKNQFLYAIAFYVLSGANTDKLLGVFGVFTEFLLIEFFNRAAIRNDLFLC